MDEERNPPSPLFEPKCKKISPKIYIYRLKVARPFHIPFTLRPFIHKQRGLYC